METVLWIIGLLIAIGAGIGIGYWFASSRKGSILRQAQEEAQRILEEAGSEAQRTVLAARTRPCKSAARPRRR